MAILIIDTDSREIKEADETEWRHYLDGMRNDQYRPVKTVTATVLKPLRPRCIQGMRPDQTVIIVGRNYVGDGDVWAAVTIREMREIITKFHLLFGEAPGTRRKVRAGE